MNIKDKIIELVPDCNGVVGLCIVLRAIGKAKGEEAWEYAIDSLGRFMRDWGEGRHDTTGPTWNLEQDNYDQQSGECKQFIGTLLGVTNN